MRVFIMAALRILHLFGATLSVYKLQYLYGLQGQCEANFTKYGVIRFDF